MSIFRINKTQDYTVISNKFLNDDDLSWKAKGMLAWLLSRPNEWQIYLKDMQKRSKDGRDSTANGLSELIESSYISKNAVRNDKGKFIGYNYGVHECRLSENGKPEFGQSDFGKADTNKYSSNKILKEVNTKPKKNIILPEDDSINLFYNHVKKISGKDVQLTKDRIKDIKRILSLGYEVPKLELAYINFCKNEFVIRTNQQLKLTYFARDIEQFMFAPDTRVKGWYDNQNKFWFYLPGELEPIWQHATGNEHKTFNIIKDERIQNGTND